MVPYYILLVSYLYLNGTLLYLTGILFISYLLVAYLYLTYILLELYLFYCLTTCNYSQTEPKN